MLGCWCVWWCVVYVLCVVRAVPWAGGKGGGGGMERRSRKEEEEDEQEVGEKVWSGLVWRGIGLLGPLPWVLRREGTWEWE